MKKRISLSLIAILGLSALAIGVHAAGDQNPMYRVRTLALPDHGRGNITMDYIAYDPKTGYVWVPAINIGSVYVVDTGNDNVRPCGFRFPSHIAGSPSATAQTMCS